MKRKNVRRVAALMASIMCVGCLSSCGGKKEDDSINLTWYIVGSEQRDLPLVNERVNEITKEKLGVTVDLKMLEWSAYSEKMNMVIGTKEEFDLCWTAPQTNDYYTNVGRNAFIALDELLPEYAPETWKSVKSDIWDAAKVDGKIYGIINNQIMATSYGYAVQRPIANAGNIDWASIDSYEKMDDMLAYAKANYSDKITVKYDPDNESFSNMLPVFGFEAVGGVKTLGAAKLIDGKYKIVNQYESEEFKTFIKKMREWYQKGYFKTDAATTKEVAADQAAGKFAVMFPQFMEIDTTIEDLKPDEPYQNTGVPYYCKRFINPIITTDRAIATMTAVSATSKHPVEAIKLIELVNTDKELYNTICHGIEGKHYTKYPEPVYDEVLQKYIDIEVIENSGYTPNTHWMFGNVENAYVEKNMAAPEKWKGINEGATRAGTLGFSFDSSEIQSELSMCSNVLSEYLTSLTSGSSDIENRYPEFIEKLKIAGADKIIAAKQEQLEKWLANK